LNRSGGNTETRYIGNSTHNRAADWYFESIDDGSVTPAASATTLSKPQQERAALSQR